jgi:hypothetical protein
MLLLYADPIITRARLDGQITAILALSLTIALGRITWRLRQLQAARRAALTQINTELEGEWKRELDDRFHETGIDGTGSMLVDSSFETERGVVSWQDGVRRSSWR